MKKLLLILVIALSTISSYSFGQLSYVTAYHCNAISTQFKGQTSRVERSINTILVDVPISHSFYILTDRHKTIYYKDIIKRDEKDFRTQLYFKGGLITIQYNGINMNEGGTIEISNNKDSETITYYFGPVSYMTLNNRETLEYLNPKSSH